MLRVTRKELLLSLSLVALVVAVYHQIPRADFLVLDDSLYVIENPNMGLGLSWEGIKWALTTNRGGFWIPLTWLSLLADAQIYGLNPGGFHLTNLLFHIANTLLLFVVLRKMTGSVFKSAFVAALFGVHPMHVESVAWITERKDVLFGFFWLLSLWAYAQYVKKPGLKAYLLVALFFALGLMAKPMIVTLPFVLLLLDYWPLNRMPPQDSMSPNQGFLRLAAEKIPLLAIAVGFSILTFYLQKRMGAVAPLNSVPLDLRMVNALISYAIYAIKTVWPYNIAAYYPMPEHIQPWWMWSGALAMLTGITFLAIFLRKSCQFFIVGWLIFLGVLFPVIGISQSGPQAMAARFMYIPAIGLYIVITWGGSTLLSRIFPKRAILAIGSIGVVFALAILGFVQTTYWTDGITLLQHSIEITGKNSFGYEIMGGTALRDRDGVKAAIYLKKALEINPNNEKTLMGMSAAMGFQDNLEEAIRYCEESVKIKPDYAKAVIYLGVLYFKAGELEKGREILNKIKYLKIDDSPITQLNLGKISMLNEDLEKAKKYFRKTLQMDPQQYEAHSYLGNIALKENKEDLAIEEYMKAIEIEPSLPEENNQLGLLFIRKGLTGLALDHFEKAHKQDPNFLDATYNLAYLLYRVRAYSRSEALLWELLEKSPDSQDAKELLKKIQQVK